MSLSFSGHGPVGIGPTVRTIFDLNHLLEGLVPDMVALAVRLSQANPGQDTVQFVAVSVCREYPEIKSALECWPFTVSLRSFIVSGGLLSLCF